MLLLAPQMPLQRATRCEQYIAKAFATLEGIGLSADPQYSILNETLPYISERILTDPSPRTAGALETFVFGEAKEDRSARVLDADRVSSLLGSEGKRIVRHADAASDLLDGDCAAADCSTDASAADGLPSSLLVRMALAKALHIEPL